MSHHEPGPVWRSVLLAAGFVLGMALMIGGDGWRTRSRPPTQASAPVGLPAGSYAAPGDRG